MMHKIYNLLSPEQWLNELQAESSFCQVVPPESVISVQAPHKQNSVVCGLCNKILTTSLERRTHKLVCKRISNICCPECGTVFRRKDNLRVHMRNQHNIGDPTVCRGCGMCFRSYLRLNEHMNKCEAVKRSLTTIESRQWVALQQAWLQWCPKRWRWQTVVLDLLYGQSLTLRWEVWICFCLKECVKTFNRWH